MRILRILPFLLLIALTSCKSDSKTKADKPVDLGGFSFIKFKKAVAAKDEDARLKNEKVTYRQNLIKKAFLKRALSLDNYSKLGNKDISSVSMQALSSGKIALRVDVFKDEEGNTEKIIQELPVATYLRSARMGKAEIKIANQSMDYDLLRIVAGLEYSEDKIRELKL